MIYFLKICNGAEQVYKTLFLLVAILSNIKHISQGIELFQDKWIYLLLKTSTTYLYWKYKQQKLNDWTVLMFST